MDWSVQQIAKLAGTTSRTLRHYDDIGLLRPGRTGDNGYRYYSAMSRTRRRLWVAIWKQPSRQLGNDWIAASQSGVAPDSEMARDLARRQVE